MSLLITILVFLLMISVLVAAHELGHFLFARLFHMDVEEFAIGFGKGKFTWMRRKGTDFTLRPIPLGGFVRIKGMIPEEDGSEVLVPNGFYSKPPWQRFVVLLAGPVFSILFGVIVLAGLYTIVGRNQPINAPIVAALAPDMPAAQSGIKIGDKVLSIDGTPVADFYSILKVVRDSAGKTLQFQVQRGSETVVVPVVPKLDSKPSEVIGPDLRPIGRTRLQGKIGAGWDIKRVRLPLGEALVAAWDAPLDTFRGLLALVAKPATAGESVGGPIRIAQVTDEAVKDGLATVFALAALLSISLGFMNLLPIPPLDGGQMVVATVEMLRRGRRISMRVQSAVSTVGFMLVMAMIVGVLYIDLTRTAPKQPSPSNSSPAK